MSMHHVAIALLFDFLQMADGTLYPVHQSTNNIKQAEYHKQLVNTYNVNVIYEYNSNMFSNSRAVLFTINPLSSHKPP